MANPTARSAVRQLEARGLLVEWSEKRWPRVYLARHVLDAVLHPLEDLRSGPGAAEPDTAVKSEATQAQKPPRRADRLMAEAMDTIDAARAQGVQLCASPAVSPCAATAPTSTSWTASTRTSTSSGSSTRRRRSTTSSRASTTRRTGTSRSPPTSGQLQYIKNEALEGMKAEAEARGPGWSAPTSRRSSTTSTSSSTSCAWTTTSTCSDRLEIDDYAISPADAFIAKMQIGKINQKDVHDVIALVKDVPLRDVDDDTLARPALHRRGVLHDWGLYRDITANLDIALAMVGDYGLTEAQQDRVYARLAAIKESVESAGKSLRWRLRATVGERVAWRREIEDTEGTEIIAPEWD